MELGADGLPVLPAKDQAEINAMKRQAQEAEMAALKLLGEDTSGAVQAKPLSMFNRVSSAARAAQRQTAQYLRLRASRDSKVSSAPSTPGSLTPAPLQKAPEPEPMPVPVAAPVEPAKKPSKHVQRSKKAPPAKKAARAGLLEAVEADVRAEIEELNAEIHTEENELKQLQDAQGWSEEKKQRAGAEWVREGGQGRWSAVNERGWGRGGGRL